MAMMSSSHRKSPIAYEQNSSPACGVSAGRKLITDNPRSVSAGCGKGISDRHPSIAAA